MSANPISATLCGLIIVLGGFGLAAKLSRLRGTTLVIPGIWLMASWIVMGISEAALWGQQTMGSEKWRYLAAITTLCPALGVLGAKRPHDGGWQVIVVTLWGILALPAIQSFVFSPSGRLTLHSAWWLLLGFAWLMGLTNYLPTRQAMGACCAASAQAVWILQAMGHVGRGGPLLPWALAGTAVGLLTVSPKNRSPREHSLLGWDLVWRDFRNLFGCVWALRVAERVNQVARSERLNMHLSWQGFKRATDSRRPEVDVEDWTPVEHAVRGILRRFVSNEWLAARLERPSQDASSAADRS